MTGRRRLGSRGQGRCAAVRTFRPHEGDGSGCMRERRNMQEILFRQNKSHLTCGTESDGALLAKAQESAVGGGGGFGAT